ncbi:30S ribosomal protein S20 [Candidatus Curtissbacteria bacterium RBG_16_39_7]|uniref:Small ribosomal subunit protein bS20 n=1 Tax=Candidatus Curtissbacteria bacterium RBG_16_39_7 TaxID=1797707 RepID=A0A1F5G384_9BACT|nr:MAG: 30S ribosomal protein S20 [Candidatus Curtissbacteria bacterium RBG_16_39_7]
MPIIKSAKKKLRQDIVRQHRNKAKKEKLKKAIKNFMAKPAQEKFSTLQGIVDKAVKSGLIKKNRAARLKSRLSKIIVQKETPTKQKRTGKKNKATT